VAGDSVRVSTIDHVEEFHVHRLVWMSPMSFLITGLDKGSKFKRVHLRLPNKSEAELAASAIASRLTIQEERLPTVEEIRVEARFPTRGRELVLLFYSLFIRLVLWVIVIQVLAFAGVLGLVLGVAAFVGFFGLWVWAAIQQGRARFEAWLRLEEKSLIVRTSAGFENLVPRIVQWKGSETFLLSGAGRKVQIYLPTNEEAAQLVSRIRAGFPGVREITDLKGST
jgi:hypothetical protein